MSACAWWPNISLATGAAAPQGAGLISGLINAARQIGGSIGLAILTTVAATQGASSAPADRVHQLVTGYDRAFLVTTGFCAAAAVVAAVFAPRAHREEPSTVPGPAAEQDHVSA
ncbi:MFS transporter [Streptomyces sp. TR1341]|uniref:MFS transporter n=1 Tax=Streptomyces sp. TR1341 TaxID=2601266 RepID=UPI00138B06DA|nr:MFS transporter [Streptomyces sp. TR1341]